MVFNGFVVILRLLSFFLFLVEFLVEFADVFNELDDSFEVVVVDAVLDLILKAVSVVAFEERIEQLGDAVFHCFLL